MTKVSDICPKNYEALVLSKFQFLLKPIKITFNRVLDLFRIKDFVPLTTVMKLQVDLWLSLKALLMTLL